MAAFARFSLVAHRPTGSNVCLAVDTFNGGTAAVGDTAVTITPSGSVFRCAGLDEHSHGDGSLTADSSASLTSASRCPGRGGDGMFAWVIPLVTLTALEVVLGIDNIIFIALVTGRLPAGQQAPARRLGLALALVSRLLLLQGTISAAQVIELLTRLQQRHPETKTFILYLDNARYQHARAVRAWVEARKAHGVEFVLDFLPAYSPNLNLIERLWKFLRKHALQQWHPTYEAMQAAVAEVLDNLHEYREELTTLMTERFHLVPAMPVEAVPVWGS
jgi:transposase